MDFAPNLADYAPSSLLLGDFKDSRSKLYKEGATTNTFETCNTDSWCIMSSLCAFGLTKSYGGNSENNLDLFPGSTTFNIELSMTFPGLGLNIDAYNSFATNFTGLMGDTWTCDTTYGGYCQATENCAYY